MAGTIPYSLSQQFDALGNVLAGGRLYLLQAGTVSTPQNAYQDSALTLALPNPIVLDAAGRLPQFFLADGSIKIRLTDVNGVNQVTADGILVVGASSGGGGGSPVDATTVLTTGDLKARYGTGTLSGFVRSNGRTIGSATSGATERANSDTQALFEYLYDADTNLAVSGGRGASAAADWASNKALALPDFRGRLIAGLDDMGSTAAGRLTATYFGTAATVLGAAGGSESRNLTIANLNSFTPTGNFTLNMQGGYPTAGAGVAANTLMPGANNTAGFTGSSPLLGSITMAALGSGAAHAIASPMMLATIYLKL